MKKIKKISVTIVVGLVLVCALATSVFASSYSSTLSFNTTLNGAKRYFDGQSIGMSMTVNNDGTNASFNAGLWRHYRYGSSFVGSANYYGGWNDNRWSNVGPGDYNFYFAKNNPDNAAAYNAWFNSNNVYMYNY